MYARSILTVATIALVASTTAASVDSGSNRGLLQADTSCLAYSNLQIVGINADCSGKAEASCQTVNSAKETRTAAFKEWFEAGVCDSDALKEASRKLTESVAGVWINALAKVECEGEGFGCGYSISQTSIRAWGASFAQTLVDAAESALREVDLDIEGNGGFCMSDLLALRDKFGEVADEVRVGICAQDGEEEDFKEKFVDGVLEGVKDALEAAASGLCGGDVPSTCGAGGPPAIEDAIVGDLEIEYAPEDVVEPGEIPECGPRVKERCCSPAGRERAFCVCSRCANPVRKDDKQPLEGKLIWTDAEGTKCYC